MRFGFSLGRKKKQVDDVPVEEAVNTEPDHALLPNITQYTSQQPELPKDHPRFLALASYEKAVAAHDELIKRG